MQLSLNTIPSLLAGILGIIAILILLNRRQTPGAIPLALLFAAISLWSFSYAFEVMVTDLWAKSFFLKLEFIGVTWVSVFWLLFCLRFSGAKAPSTRNFFLIFSWIPIITIGLVYTNQHHLLLWSNISIDPQYSSILKIDYGIWFWAHALYSHLLYLAGLYFLIRHYFKTPRNMRHQILLVTLAGIIPGIANYLYLSGSNPFPNLDLTSLSFAITGLIIVSVLFFQRFLDIVPIARDTTIENMRDGIIVVDTNDRIVDINPAAESIVNLRFSEVIGRPSSEVLSHLTDWISSSKEDRTPVKVMTTGEGKNKKFFVLNLIPLSDSNGSLIGYTIIFHDNTESHTLNKSLKDQADRLVVLYEIGKAITSTLKIDAFAGSISSHKYLTALILSEIKL